MYDIVLPSSMQIVSHAQVLSRICSCIVLSEDTYPERHKTLSVASEPNRMQQRTHISCPRIDLRQLCPFYKQRVG